MTRTVTFIALALACAALLATGGSAAAADREGISASQSQDLRGAQLFRPLTERTARRLASSLARSTARDRNVRWWTLSQAVSRSDTRIVFIYTDRSRDNVFCTSEVVVSQPHRRFRRTRFTDSECAGVPTEALRIERALARFIRAVQGNAGEVREVRSQLLDEQLDCANLRVPRSRRTDARTLFAAWEAQAFTAVVTSDLTIVDDLAAINPQRREFAGARARWNEIAQLGFDIAQTIIAPQTAEASEALRSPCRALRRWARNGWTSETAPTGFAALRRHLASFAAAERGLARVSEALLAVGVSPRAAASMTPAGVLAVAVPEFRVCAGGPLVGCAGPG